LKDLSIRVVGDGGSESRRFLMMLSGRFNSSSSGMRSCDRLLGESKVPVLGEIGMLKTDLQATLRMAYPHLGKAYSDCRSSDEMLATSTIGGVPRWRLHPVISAGICSIEKPSAIVGRRLCPWWPLVKKPPRLVVSLDPKPAVKILSHNAHLLSPCSHPDTLVA